MPASTSLVKIFILKPSSLGDVIHALPVLRLLKRHLPHAEIHWWIEASLAPLLQDDPDLAGLVLFHRYRWNSIWNWGELWQSIQAIRAHRFDWVIDLQSLARSGLFAWLANGELTVGLDDPREGARGLYDIIVPRPSSSTHAVDWYLEVLKPLGIPVHHDFTWLPERPAAARALREKWRPEGSCWIAIQPGARWDNKRWPVEYFAQLVARLASDLPKTKFAILGSNADRESGESIARSAPGRSLNLAGYTTLPEMIEWIRLCDVVVTNDTGPMHVAAALGRPVVALFGPTDPQRTGPYGSLHAVLRHALPCAPCMRESCHHHQPLECLRSIQPAAVADCVVGLLDRVETNL
jgi:lipopolysaccharide heptosyltransferase II